MLRSWSLFAIESRFPHDQVLRNQIVGSSRILAACGPLLATAILIRISSTSAFAYSTKTSKYRLSSKMPVKEFKFRLVFSAMAVFLYQVCVGELGLWIFVQVLHVGMRRRRVEIEVIFLDVFPVIALIAGKPKQPLLKNRVLLVPECKSKQRSCRRSEIPAKPSSFQRYARERAWL